MQHGKIEVHFPAEYQPLPSERYIHHVNKELYGFTHFHLNMIDTCQHYCSNGLVAVLFVLLSHLNGSRILVILARRAGTPVLISDQCGSSYCVKVNPLPGNVFCRPTVKTLRSALKPIIIRGIPTEERKQQIIARAAQYISRSALADHFLRIVDVASRKSPERTTSPWVQDRDPQFIHS